VQSSDCEQGCHHNEPIYLFEIVIIQQGATQEPKASVSQGPNCSYQTEKGVVRYELLAKLFIDLNEKHGIEELRNTHRYYCQESAGAKYCREVSVSFSFVFPGFGGRTGGIVLLFESLVDARLAV